MNVPAISLEHLRNLYGNLVAVDDPSIERGRVLEVLNNTPQKLMGERAQAHLEFFSNSWG